jgi:hypothetical protein
MSESEDPFEAYKSHRILLTVKVVTIHIPVRGFHLTEAECTSESIEILISFVALDHEHLKQRHLITKTLIKLLEVLSYSTVAA